METASVLVNHTDHTVDLCTFCEGLSRWLCANNTTWLEDDKKTVNHGDCVALHTSASATDSLWQFILDILPGHPTLPKSIRINIDVPGDRFAVAFETDAKKNTVSSYLEFYRPTDSPIAGDGVRTWKVWVTGQSIFLDPRDAVQALAIPWINHCRAGHKTCAQPQDAALPTRILDVGREGDSIFLRSSNGLSGEYTILTHCWGTRRTLTTTPQTFTRMMTGFAYSELPATFKDAVTVTRMLGISYLWIDSLCIIQDPRSPKDWLVESSKMLDYYKNAYVTISALDSKDSFTGFLQKRDGNLSESSFRHSHLTKNAVSDVEEIHKMSVLGRRAWCLQERLVSTRILHFGQSNLIWECRNNAKYCENYVLHDSLILQSEKMRAEFLNVKNSSTHALSSWYSLVEQYSARNLTFPHDRLQAIAAIASEIQLATSYTYISGLWKEDLVKGLIWREAEEVDDAISTECNAIERLKSGAPSWSWAYRTGKIAYEFTHKEELGEFSSRLEILSWTSSDDHEIVLRGRCREITILRGYEEKLQLVRYSQRQEFEDNLLQSWRRDRLLSSISRVRDQSGAYDLGRVHLDDAERFWDEAYKAKALEALDCTFAERGNPEVHTRHHFLVLMPHESKKGKWIRVGLGIAYPTMDEVPWHYRELARPDYPDGENTLPYMFDGCEERTICLV